MTETTAAGARADAEADAGAGDDAAGAMVSLFQKQQKIYARAVSGLFATWRWSMVCLTQLLFYGLPWLNWNGRQAVLFDLDARRFYIGPLLLYPQDFIYLTAILVIAACALFLFTAVAGRLWCGFACPQTVYTEIFMGVQRRIEGDRIARMRLDQAGWTLNKLWRKAATQTVWVAIALWTGFTFVGYFTPIKSLAASALQGGLGPWEWFWVLFYALATYGNAGFLREQVCKYMCPYARFQGVMFDPDTLIISYDAQRGEPRGSRPRKANPAAAGLGSCIDCGLCVQVCPTGIDIRQGLQNECIGCAACIDVCNSVMDKMQYPTGLIRYDTQNGLAQHLSRRQRLARIFRPRVVVYAALLVLAVAGLLASLVLRAPFKLDVVRDRAVLARQVDDGQIENLYRLHLMNATEQPQQYRVAVAGLPGLVLAAVPALQLAATEARWVVVAVRLPPEQAQRLGPGAHALHFAVSRVGDGEGVGVGVGDGVDAQRLAAQEVTVMEKSTFVVPQ